MWNVFEYDCWFDVLFVECDEDLCKEMICDFIVEIVVEVFYFWLLLQYFYIVWWLWVQNYGGEFRVGVVWLVLIYVCFWIDQEMKKVMGF